MYLSEGSLSLFVLSFPFSFACIRLYSTATCIFHVYFVCLFQVLLIYLLSLPIKKQKNEKRKKKKMHNCHAQMPLIHRNGSHDPSDPHTIVNMELRE